MSTKEQDDKAAQYRDPVPMGEYLDLAMNALDKADGISKALWKVCAGVILLSGEEGGILFSMTGTSGVALAHKDGKWSAPVAVSLTGAGFGLTAGYAKKDIVILLNHFAMDKLLKGDGQMTVGADAGFAVGKHGKSMGGEIALSDKGGMGSSFVFTYQSGALVNLEVVFGAETTALSNVNRNFYDTNSASKIMTEGIDKVPEGSKVHTLLAKLDEKTAD